MDPRIEFAEDVCKLLCEQYGDLENRILPDLRIVEKYYNHFFENVRNIYQFVDSDIPLFRYFELAKEEFEGTLSEYAEVIEAIRNKCINHYK